jgi:predicted Zn-dependent protease
MPLCVDRNRWTVGAFYANKYDFPKEMQDTAISSLGMSDVLVVYTIIDDAPAATSGLKEGDVLVRVNDKQVPTGEGASKKLTEILNEELKDGEDITLIVKQDGLQESFKISPVKVCDYPLVVVNQDDVNAYADGNNIVIFQGMMDFAKTDEELSMVVAHELAHNNMRHIEAKKTNFFVGLLADILVTGLTGVDFGIRNAAAGAYSKDFESEADYVGMYIMARAGMDLDNAPEFWRRMGSRNPRSIEDNYLASHPSTPERFVALEESIREIKLKQESAQDLMPNIDEKARTSREPPPSQASQLGFGK